MDVQNPAWEDVFAAWAQSTRDSLFTAMPGVVQEYDATKQTVAVQPAVRHAYTNEAGDRVAKRLPVIPSAPVAFPRGGGCSITWPISPGDTGLIVFTNCSTDRWASLGGADVDPVFDHRHHPSDAYFIPGGGPPFAPGGPLSPTPSTSALTITANEVLLGGGDAGQAVVVQSALADFMSALTTAIAAAPTDAGLPALKAALYALNDGLGWVARTSVTKAK